jgi:hypothetical protein
MPLSPVSGRVRMTSFHPMRSLLMSASRRWPGSRSECLRIGSRPAAWFDRERQLAAFQRALSSPPLRDGARWLDWTSSATSTSAPNHRSARARKGSHEPSFQGVARWSHRIDALTCPLPAPFLIPQFVRGRPRGDMKKSRFTGAQIIGVPREYVAGSPTAEVCRRQGSASKTSTGGRPSPVQMTPAKLNIALF